MSLYNLKYAFKKRMNNSGLVDIKRTIYISETKLLLIISEVQAAIISIILILVLLRQRGVSPCFFQQGEGEGT